MKYYRFVKIAFFILVITFSNSLQSQCYELVWSDEFNYNGFPASSKWTAETGGGGWGNNELQFYTENDTDNAYVEDGRLVITALKEDYSTNDYTSARLITRDLFEVQYGKIESRIKLPYSQGIWPAFWMLGANYPEVGWPACGEIDIMEMIGGENNDNTIYGTTHWANNGQHAEYGSSFTLESGIFADNFHVFSIEWDENTIRWLIDGQQYHVINITPKELIAFRNDFFILLNVAVGGNWPGYPDETSIFPQTMEVDYVRVYKKPENVPQLKITGDTVVHQLKNDTKYSLPHSPEWHYNWSVGENAEIIGRADSSTIMINWGCNADTITCTVTGSCGSYMFNQAVHIDQEINGPIFIEANETGIIFTFDNISGTNFDWSVPEDATIISGEFNDTLEVNWGNVFEPVYLKLENSCGITQLQLPVIRFGQYPFPDINNPHKIPGNIIATDFDYGGEGLGYHDNTNGNNGEGPRQDTDVDTEYNDNGSPNVGWIQDGEWLEYTIRVDSSAYYEITMRVAAAISGGPFSFLFNGEERLSGINVENTSGWDSFKTITAGTVYLTTADTLMRVSINSGGFNLGKMTFTTTTEPNEQVIPESIARLRIYPVPATDFLTYESSDQVREVTIYDINGRAVLQLKNINAHKKTISISDLPPGVHMVRITTTDGNSYYDRILKLTYK